MNKAYFEFRGNNSIDFDFWRYGNDLGLKLDNIEINTICNELSQLNNHISILDIGCGTGYHLNSILKSIPSANLTGIDFSRSYIEKAKSICDNRIKFLECPTDEISQKLKGQKYDVVLMIGLLQYLDDNQVKKLVLSLNDLLENEGRVIIKHPVLFGRQTYECESIREGHPYKSFYRTFDDLLIHFYQSFSVDNMKSLFKKNHLTDDELSRIDSQNDTKQMIITLTKQ